MTEPLILVTGAAGKTGLAVIRSLAKRGARVRGLIRRAEQEQVVRGAGAAETLIGDLADLANISTAMQGVTATYLLFPNLHPTETELGLSAITAAKQQGVQSLVYHSVLYPQLEAMPHHWQKLRVEEAVIQSGLPFTILQPASYIQNISNSLESIKSSGVYHVPYSINAIFSPIDLDDVAAAACTCVLDPGHRNAIYQLAGAEYLTTIQMAQTMTQVLGREVVAQQQKLEEWRAQAMVAHLTPYAIETLLSMFRYYDQQGLAASSQTIEWLLGRPPTTFRQYLEALTK